MRITILFIIITALISICCNNQNDNLPVRNLREGFLHPPDSVRPGVYWYFMDGNLSRKAITADLESMKKAGIGNVLFLEVNVGLPRGKVDFLSEEWQELFAHAMNECKRLGITMTLGVGPGWTGSGGPWVKASESMRHLVSSSVEVTGSTEKIILPKPDPKLPYFGMRSLTPELQKIWNDYYKDVAVLAYPTPAGNAKIDLINEKALFVRAPYTSRPGVRPYLPEPFYPSSDTLPGAIDKSKVIDLTARLKADGTLDWKVPDGKWTIIRFGMRNNGMVTRPAPLPGMGFECDKFDTVAFKNHFDAFIGKLFAKTDFTMGSRDGGLFRLTSQELVLDNHAAFVKKMGKRYGLDLSIQPYDMNPCADLDLGAVADVPSCEFWMKGVGHTSVFSCIEATSIAHVMGRPVVAAEAFTAKAGQEGYIAYPEVLKNQGDWAFATGINHFIYHTFAHKSLGETLKPGMTMGPYGVHWDRGQTWWPMVTEYHEYVSRCSYILRHGQTVADVLYLTPEGAPQVFVPPHSAMEGNDTIPDRKAYNFDGCSPLMLIANATVENHKIVFPGGASYHLLVLPARKTMTPELLDKIESLVKEGANVLGMPPVKSPGLSNFPECDQHVKAIAEKLWNNTKVPDRLTIREYGKGKIYWGGELSQMENELYPHYDATMALLKRLGIHEDFRANGQVRYTHKKVAGSDIYFIANRTDQAFQTDCIFRTEEGMPELWNPLNGQIRDLPEFNVANGQMTIPVTFEPYQSFFIIFYKSKPIDPTYRSDRKNFVPVREIQTLEGPWEVSFNPKWGGPKDITFNKLEDWAQRPEDGIKFYSGIATYNQSFNLVKSNVEGGRLFLDLGEVKNIARVILNGKDMGVVWTAPWQVEITDSVNVGNNQLKIEVANLWVNRLIGDEQLPDDGIKNGQWPDWLVNGTPRTSGRYTFSTYKFYKKESPLMKSGLLGPVKILMSVNNKPI